MGAKIKIKVMQSHYATVPGIRPLDAAAEERETEESEDSFFFSLSVSQLPTLWHSCQEEVEFDCLIGTFRRDNLR